MKNYPIVTLCGSTKFEKEFNKVQYDLTMAGNIVISVGVFGNTRDNDKISILDPEKWKEKKIMLDDMHKRKIDMADSIFVVNPNGYIGDSTWSEIVYATMSKMPIESMEPIDKDEILRRCEQFILLK